jgi:uncharacterized coiled-coil protein SlyX
MTVDDLLHRNVTTFYDGLAEKVAPCFDIDRYCAVGVDEINERGEKMSDGSMTGAPVAAQESALKKTMNELNASVGRLEDSVAKLLARVQYLTVPEGPEGESGPVSPMPTMSNLEYEITEAQMRLDKMQAQVHDTNQRLRV